MSAFSRRRRQRGRRSGRTRDRRTSGGQQRSFCSLTLSRFKPKMCWGSERERERGREKWEWRREGWGANSLGQEKQQQLSSAALLMWVSVRDGIVAHHLFLTHCINATPSPISLSLTLACSLTFSLTHTHAMRSPLATHTHTHTHSHALTRTHTHSLLRRQTITPTHHIHRNNLTSSARETQW